MVQQVKAHVLNVQLAISRQDLLLQSATLVQLDIMLTKMALLFAKVRFLSFFLSVFLSSLDFFSNCMLQDAQEAHLPTHKEVLSALCARMERMPLVLQPPSASIVTPVPNPIPMVYFVIFFHSIYCFFLTPTFILFIFIHFSC